MRWNVSPPPYTGSRRTIKKFIWWPTVLPFGQDGELVCAWLQYAWINQRHGAVGYTAWSNMHWESFEGAGE